MCCRLEFGEARDFTGIRQGWREKLVTYSGVLREQLLLVATGFDQHGINPLGQATEEVFSIWMIAQTRQARLLISSVQVCVV